MYDTLLRPEIAVLVLLAALLHAVWNALVKAGNDRMLILAAVNAVGLLVAALVIPFVDFPHSASWPYLLLSCLLHYGYYFFLLQSYRVGDLSHVYPLARGTAPLLVALGAFLFAQEILPWTAMVGVVLACCGIISLAFEGGPPWREDPRALLFALGTSLFIASYTVVDGIGVRLSGSPLGYIVWLFFLDGWILAIYAVYKRGRQTTMQFWCRQWKVCIGGGLASTVAYGLVIYAMSTGAMAAVSALRETSVIMAVIIGALQLREQVGWQRITAASMVVVGVGGMHLAN